MKDLTDWIIEKSNKFILPAYIADGGETITFFSNKKKYSGIVGFGDNEDSLYVEVMDVVLMSEL